MPLPLSGVAVRWISRPSRSTPSVQRLADGALDDVGHGVRVGERLAVDGDDGVPRLEARQRGRRRLDAGPVLERGHLVVVGRLPEAEDQDDGQDEGDEEVHGRAGRGHDDALVEGLLAVGPGLVLGRTSSVEVKPVMRT